MLFMLRKICKKHYVALFSAFVYAPQQGNRNIYHLVVKKRPRAFQ